MVKGVLMVQSLPVVLVVKKKLLRSAQSAKLSNIVTENANGFIGSYTKKLAPGLVHQMALMLLQPLSPLKAVHLMIQSIQLMK